MCITIKNKYKKKNNYYYYYDKEPHFIDLYNIFIFVMCEENIFKINKFISFIINASIDLYFLIKFNQYKNKWNKIDVMKYVFMRIHCYIYIYIYN